MFHLKGRLVTFAPVIGQYECYSDFLLVETLDFDPLSRAPVRDLINPMMGVSPLIMSHLSYHYSKVQ